MVHSSVRRRVTVWYTLIIVILLVSVIAILLAAMSVSSSNSKEGKKDKLSDTVRLAIEELSNDRIKGGDKPSDIKKPDGKEEKVEQIAQKAFFLFLWRKNGKISEIAVFYGGDYGKFQQVCQQV